MDDRNLLDVFSRARSGKLPEAPKDGHPYSRQDGTWAEVDPAGAASAVQSDLNTHKALSTTAHGGIVASSDSRLTDARTPTTHDNTKHSTAYLADAPSDGTAYSRKDGAWSASPGGGGTPASSVTDETTFGVVKAVGTGTNYAREDHTHGTPAAPTAASVGALGLHAKADTAGAADTAVTLATGTDRTKLDGIAAGATVGADWNVNVTNKPTLGTSAAKNIPASGNASATEVVYGSDTRLTDTRTPAAHAASHRSDGGDPLVSATAATSAASGTMTVTMPAGDGVITNTPTNACTFNATGGKPGARCSFVITTSGSSSYTLTFGTNFKPQGTLATGTSTGKVFAVSFICKDGTTWVETGRTAAM